MIMVEEGSILVLFIDGILLEIGSEVIDREREKVKVEDLEDGEMEEMDFLEFVLFYQEVMLKVEVVIDEIVLVS